MDYQLPLNEMTLSDKLQLMERLWNNLCHLSESVPSPDWHETVLSDRKQRVAEGTAKFTLWSKAKHAIRSSLS